MNVSPQIHSEEKSHIGMQLAAARNARDLSLSDVSKALHINADYLDAIERLDVKALPSAGYVLGFLRSYAKFLDMDTASAIAEYKNDSAIPENLGMRDCPHFVEKRRIRLPKGSIAAMLAMSAFLSLGVWYATSTDAQPSLGAVPSPVQASALATSPQMPTVGDPDVISIRATGPSWIQITDDQGRIVSSKIFTPGEVFETRIDAGLKLTARDGGVIDLYRGGENLGPIAARGGSVKALPLQ